MNKRKKSSKKKSRRYKAPVPPMQIRKVAGDHLPIVGPEICEMAMEQLNDALTRGCKQRSHFVVESGRPCAKGAGKGVPADLVVLIDTSGSMQDEALELSNAAEEAINKAAKSCPSDLRVAWLGIEGTWSNTKFTESYRNYLQAQVGPNIIVSAVNNEDGAGAIIDIVEQYDWRPGASRAIFYLGDEALKGGNPLNQEDIDAMNDAITVAQNKSVKVFTYYGSETGVAPPRDPNTINNYRNLAESTGGKAYVSPSSSLGGFQAILEQIICASVSVGCAPVPVPKIKPCFELWWGDGPQDRIETDDVELLCITAWNPYSNITLKNLTVLISIVTDEDGSAVASLPDKTPSVLIKPTYIICFGDIPPCDPGKPKKLSRVTREAVLISRGAKEGKYLVNIAYCYSIKFTMIDMDRFEIELVKS